MKLSRFPSKPFRVNLFTITINLKIKHDFGDFWRGFSWEFQWNCGWKNLWKNRVFRVIFFQQILANIKISVKRKHDFRSVVISAIFSEVFCENFSEIADEKIRKNRVFRVIFCEQIFANIKISVKRKHDYRSAIIFQYFSAVFHENFCEITYKKIAFSEWYLSSKFSANI